MIVILYVMDSLRKDHLSCYGYERKTSPNIDKLAKDSAVFDETFSQSTWTKPSGASILSSLYPSVHKTNYLNQSLPSNILTLPKFLKEKGFKTIGISAMGNISTIFGFDNGFDHFIDLYNEDLGEKRKLLNKDSFMWGNYFDSSSATIATSEDINNYVFKFLEKYPNENLFFFLWSIDTHAPYFHRDSNLNRFWSKSNEPILLGKDYSKMKKKEELYDLKDLYDDMIYYNDFYIGKLIDKMKEMDLYNEALFLLTSDHGESFNEHGFNGHAGIPYEEQIEVPLIMKFQYNKKKIDRINGLIQHIDIAPTILNSLKYNVPKSFQGKSILPLLRENKTINKSIYIETKINEFSPIYYSIRTKDYKYIGLKLPKFKSIIKNKSIKSIYRYIKFNIRNNREKLYNIKKDKKETKNIINSSSYEIKKIKELLNWYNQLNKEHIKFINISTKKTTMNEDIKNKLRLLGYLD